MAAYTEAPGIFKIVFKDSISVVTKLRRCIDSYLKFIQEVKKFLEDRINRTFQLLFGWHKHL